MMKHYPVGRVLASLEALPYLLGGKCGLSAGGARLPGLQGVRPLRIQPNEAAAAAAAAPSDLQVWWAASNWSAVLPWIRAGLLDWTASNCIPASRSTQHCWDRRQPRAVAPVKSRALMNSVDLCNLPHLLHVTEEVRCPCLHSIGRRQQHSAQTATWKARRRTSHASRQGAWLRQRQPGLPGQ